MGAGIISTLFYFWWKGARSVENAVDTAWLKSETGQEIFCDGREKAQKEQLVGKSACTTGLYSGPESARKDARGESGQEIRQRARAGKENGRARENPRLGHGEATGDFPPRTVS